MREFDLIARITERTAGTGGRSSRRDDIVIGLGDDAAVLAPAPGMRLVACTDTLVRGVHYPADTAPADIGWKALAVNLSDIAAMGATPRWALVALTVPEVHAPWVDGFLDGWLALADAHGVALVGGDTTRGPETITVTVLGEVPSGAALQRSGAVAGDRVWVSGTLGDAAAALRCLQPGPHPNPPPLRGGGSNAPATPTPPPHPAVPLPPLAGEGRDGGRRTAPEHGHHTPPSPDAVLLPPLAGEGRDGGRRAAPEHGCHTLHHRLTRPTPRLALGRALRNLATSCIDLSDGLHADLGHLTTASGVAAEISIDALPTSEALHALLPATERWPLQLAGGDDYELCFTAPPSRDAALHALATDLGLRLTPVGRILVGSGVRVVDADNREYTIPRRGYEHFA